MHDNCYLGNFDLNSMVSISSFYLQMDSGEIKLCYSGSFFIIKQPSVLKTEVGSVKRTYTTHTRSKIRSLEYQNAPPLLLPLSK